MRVTLRLRFTPFSVVTFGVASFASMFACDDASPVDPTTDTAADLSDVSTSDADTVGSVLAPACRDRATQAPLQAGRWASRQFRAAIVKLPPTNTPTTVVTTTLVLHDVTAGADPGLRQVTHMTCQLRQPKLNGVETVFGPRFIASVPINTVTATVLDQAVTVAADLVVLGATLDATDLALPTTATDPRVRDTDDDGNPGVSVTLRGLFAGQIFVVYRQSFGLSGTADASGCMQGRVVGSGEQSQIGATPKELEQINLAPVPHPDPSLSTFTWIPVDAALDCEGLIARELELFGPAP